MIRARFEIQRSLPSAFATIVERMSRAAPVTGRRGDPDEPWIPLEDQGVGADSVFPDRAAATREKRPLLDLGVDVLYLNDDGAYVAVPE